MGKANVLLLLLTFAFFLITVIGLNVPHSYCKPATSIRSTDVTNLSKTPNTLSPRFLELTNGWVMSWDTWAFQFPIPDAARTLENFYDLVVESVGREWRFQPPMQSFSFRYGLFELRFDSEDLIGWEAVSFIASLMAESAESGFAGLYQIRLYHAVGGIMVRVALKLIAPGDGG